MKNWFRNLFSDDSEEIDAARRRALWEQHQRKKAAKEAQQRLESDATRMIGMWGWDLGKRSLPERVALLTNDRKVQARLFDQYPGEFFYLVKTAMPERVTRTLYRATGTRQLHAAFLGHAQAGIDGGHDVACCIVLPDYASTKPVHECPFLPSH